METVTVDFDADRALKAYRKYFDYNRQEQVKRIPLVWLMGVGAVFLVIGLFTQVSLWLSIGAVVLGGAGLSAAGIWMLYTLKFRSFSKHFRKDASISELSFEFGFDEDGMSTKAEQVYSRVKWEIIAYYIEDDGDIYLILRNGRLHDVISEAVLGKEKYEKFRGILKLREIPKQ